MIVSLFREGLLPFQKIIIQMQNQNNLLHIQIFYTLKCISDSLWKVSLKIIFEGSF